MTTIYYGVSLKQSFDYDQGEWVNLSSVFKYVDNDLFDAIVDQTFERHYPGFKEVIEQHKGVKLNFYAIASYIYNY